MTESHKDAARDEVYALHDHDTPEAEWDTEDAFEAPAPLYRNRWAASQHDGDQLDLEERASLRRVAGLSTELEDVTEVEYRQLRLERVVLVGVWTDGTAADAENFAARARRARRDGRLRGARRPDPAPRRSRTRRPTSARGKAQELRDIVLATGADTVVCDGELSPGQRSTLEDVVKVKVIDRTALILDIFAQHAKSREGKAQVELAQLEYLLPRLRGWGESMSRQAGGRSAGGGGMGTRGPGETKIETDRRRIRDRMAKLRREIADMKQGRETKRAGRRKRRAVPSVAIAGYTNAGKSSLLNRLTGAGVLVENALFATLDPTVRARADPDGPRLHAGRHGRLRPPPAAPAGRGVPLDAGGGRRRRPDPARRRRLRTPTPRARSAAVRERLRRHRRRRRARAHRLQQGRPGRPGRPGRGCCAASRTASSSRPAPARASTSCSRLSSATCPAPASSWRRSSRTTAATWSPASTTTARC